MKVIIESPYAGEIERNIDYARKCMKDSLLWGEFPLASHLLYTQPGILDDSITIERNLGIAAGLEWGKMAEKTIVYTDYGISKGMQFGIENAIENNREVQYRTIL
jgi:hypothetical protein